MMRLCNTGQSYFNFTSQSEFFFVKSYFSNFLAVRDDLFFLIHELNQILTACPLQQRRRKASSEDFRGPHDNKYHILGQLEFVDRAVMKNLINISTPLLRAGGKANKIILSLMRRFATKKCCENKDHIHQLEAVLPRGRKSQ
jgi:hypothetical protein